MKSQFSILEKDAIERKLAHEQKLSPFIDAFRHWRERGKKHPIYDFLFSYYSFSSGQLLRWSPGIGVSIQLETVDEASELIQWPDHVKVTTHSCYIDHFTFPFHRMKFLDWAINYLENTAAKNPVFHCFGLHEWAMVFKADARHHPETPLRVSEEVVANLLYSQPLCCTHYDAFRFFPPLARPLNRYSLSRESVIDHDQAGCIHANMDLYKLAYKVAPYISSELLADLFLLARQAREIDMRASPYDLEQFGVMPIPIETREGRETFLQYQRQLSQEAQPLRSRLLEFFRSFRSCILTSQVRTVTKNLESRE